MIVLWKLSSVWTFIFRSMFLTYVINWRYKVCNLWNSLASITVPSSIPRLIKTSKVANELAILSNSSWHFNNFLLYFLEINSRIPPTQVETVLMTPTEALIGKPTTVNAVPVVETPLITPTELAPVDAFSNLLQAFLYFRCFSWYLFLSTVMSW